MIGENGVPLEVSGGYISPPELAQKFNKALQASFSSVSKAVETLLNNRLHSV